MNYTILDGILKVAQSKWMRPALMAAAILGTALGVAGCGHPH